MIFLAELSLPFVPERASSVAGQVDLLFYFLVLLTCGVLAIVFGPMAFFLYKYRKGSTADRTPDTFRTWIPELIWSGIPFVMALGIAGWGATVYAHIKTPPDEKDALEINVIGKQCMWNVQHPEGHRELNELHVPLGRTVRLVMTSQDVIHDFGIPAFRLKQDVLPARYTVQWFKATEAGRYHLFCDQLCGMGHAEMVGWVTVMTPTEYNEWVNTGTEQGTVVARGERLFRSLGCSGCHGENAQIRAPSLIGVYGAAGDGSRHRDRHRRRPLHPRLDPAAAKADRRQLRTAERDALVRWADRRRGSLPTRAVHQELGPLHAR